MCLEVGRVHRQARGRHHGGRIELVHAARVARTAPSEGTGDPESWRLTNTGRGEYPCGLLLFSVQEAGWASKPAENVGRGQQNDLDSCWQGRLSGRQGRWRTIQGPSRHVKVAWLGRRASIGDR